MDTENDNNSSVNNKSRMNYSTLSLISVLSSSAPPLSYKSSSFDTKDITFCLTSKLDMNNKELMSAIQHFSPEYTVADSKESLINLSEDKQKYFFICASFSGDEFKYLRKQMCRICGPPFLIYLYNKKRSIPNTTRPLFNGSMFGVAVCFTGFAVKRESVSHLADLVHYMGGSVRRDFSGKVTHVIANLAQGQKYKAAVNLGRSIMTEDWILSSWENRNDVSFKATEESFIKKYLMKPFHGLIISFYGFTEEETKHMHEITTSNGGTYLSLLKEESCTHLVVDEMCPHQLPLEEFKPLHVVKQEWFWASIQLDACAEESMYHIVTEEGTPLGTSQRFKKRKYLNASDISDLLSPNSPYGANKRRSKDGRLSSMSSITFESSLSSPFYRSQIDSPEIKTLDKTSQPTSARYQRCVELQQTEKNYVYVLKTIVEIFKKPLEDSANQRGGSLLAPEEIKTIFGSIPELLETHERLLHAIDKLIENWNEEVLIGKAINDNVENMIKVYPVFVNYFEIIKETIIRCDKEKPRFHAFLKICLTKPDCGRQSLTELLIRPVQRIPSMSLLINDILKKTPEFNPDYKHLKDAVESIKNVLTHINEDKRKTEHQVEMFEIMREVDNCPPYILSSSRFLIQKVDVMEVGEGFVLKPDQMMMYLFNDCIELARKRNRVINSTTNYKSPALNNLQKGIQKLYKHVEFIHLLSLRSVVDIKDSNEHQDLFGLVYHLNLENKDHLSIFKLCSSVSKNGILEKVMKCISQTQSSTEMENLMISVDGSELTSEKYDMSDIKNKSYLHKVLKKAKGGFSKKVGRAFSLNKTPKQTSLKTNADVKRALSVTPMSDSFRNLAPVSPSPSEYTVTEFSVCEDE
ncbi:protein ECT2 isoform X2 [Hydra vulgaris]|uniref:Protein ECT2 isoform X2 n=1 Tax=Hydra vulgaris TaxID=6087 RepID=A0ABM4B5V2_HYDVU